MVEKETRIFNPCNRCDPYHSETKVKKEMLCNLSIPFKRINQESKIFTQPWILYFNIPIMELQTTIFYIVTSICLSKKIIIIRKYF